MKRFNKWACLLFFVLILIPLRANGETYNNVEYSYEDGTLRLDLVPGTSYKNVLSELPEDISDYNVQKIIISGEFETIQKSQGSINFSDFKMLSEVVLEEGIACIKPNVFKGWDCYGQLE